MANLPVIYINNKTYVTNSGRIIYDRAEETVENKWNREYYVSDTDSDIEFILAEPPSEISAIIVLTFTAAENQFVTIVPPTGYKVVGLNNITYLPTVQYELVFKVLNNNVIGVAVYYTIPKKILTSADISVASKITHSTYAFTYTDKPANNGTYDGFQIVGRSSASSSVASSYAYEMGNYIFPVDLTLYSTLSFYVRKNANHGMSWVRLDPNVPTATTLGTAVTQVYQCHYNNLPTSWTLVTVDISSYKGLYYVVFGGGYADQSGNTASNTEYSGITFAP